jgi:hypothetical protein
MHAHLTSLVTRVTESLVVSHCPIGTLTLEGVRGGGVRVDRRGIGGVREKQVV